mmetsp:Transcript_18695/g.27983  ORF Transcript_18695/g.27983 Transcript_18695/m.27983 type:complete len:926 (+) Transcript_18695:63-2840(+)
MASKPYHLLTYLMTSMRGLTNFITDIRKCQNKQDERARVLKELSNIRNKFQKGARLDSYSRRKYTWKLLYIYILGYSIDIGHVEAMQLISSNSFIEKKTGYTVCAVMFNENDELLTMITQSIKHDLHKESPEPVQCLALSMVANVGGRNMSDALWKDVSNLLTSGSSRSIVRKKASLCMLRLFRKAPENVEIKVVAPKVIQMLNNNFGVAMCAIELCIGLVSYYRAKSAFPEVLKECVAKTIRLLHKLSNEGSRVPDVDYRYYGTLCPWLQVKCLRLLQLFPFPKEHSDKKRLEESLTKILNRDPKRSDRKKNRSNANHAILFETINLVIHYAETSGFKDKKMIDKCVALLGRFVSLKEASIRYMGLDTMARIAKVEGTLENIKKQLTTIQYSLNKDLDVSIRRRALDMLFVMCDESNSRKIIQELLVFMRSADYSIREELVLKIAILAERFATDLRWYIDVILKLINVAGNHVSDDIWYRVIQIVTNNDNLQGYAAFIMYTALQAELVHENGIKVGGYILGEFCDRLLSKSTSADDIFKVLYKHFPLSSGATKALLLSSFIKLANAAPGIMAKVRGLLTKYSVHADVEIQQRAVEYSVFTNSAEGKMMSEVFDVMPPFEGTVSKLEQKAMGKSSARTLWAIAGKKKDDDEDEGDDEDEDDEDEDDEVEEDEEDEEEELEVRDQTAAEFKSILQSVTSSGYLYKSSLLQIGVKMIVGQSQEMKLKIFFGNKSSKPISNLSCTTSESDECEILVRPEDPITVKAKAQEAIFVKATCFRPITKIPEMFISFIHGESKEQIKLRLPVISTNFITGLSVDGTKYLDFWNKYSKEAKAVVEFAYDDVEDLKEEITKRLHCSAIDMSGVVKSTKKMLCLIGTFNAAKKDGSKLKMPVIARFQFKPNCFQVVVHSQHSMVAENILQCVKWMH